MRRLIAILAVGVSLSVAGIAAADTTPAPTTTTPTTTAPTQPRHWFAGAVTGVGSNSLTVGVSGRARTTAPSTARASRSR